MRAGARAVMVSPVGYGWCAGVMPAVCRFSPGQNALNSCLREYIIFGDDGRYLGEMREVGVFLAYMVVFFENIEILSIISVFPLRL